MREPYNKDAMRYFFIEPSAISGKNAFITGSDENHIKKVLRLRPGDEIGLFDGEGLEYRAKIEDFTGNGIKALILDRWESPGESPVDITLAQGFLKERKMDELVRHLTELGITRYIPFMAERSVSRPPAKKMAQRLARWETISKQAIKQCKRGRFMKIEETLEFKEALKAAAPYEVKIIFWENETMLLAEIAEQLKHEPAGSVFVMIGPEGGFSEKEVDLARASGFSTAGLGPRILRAETATVTAAVLVQYLFGDMGKKPLTSE